uniref:Uncharacterized protein n=1 Tax=Vespula pensylvanica TaxID=30213 RepID=A0A834PCW5_VESPE|nr:hypothetical protein H0235_003966 [Vespula pensylvanica]
MVFGADKEDDEDDDDADNDDDDNNDDDDEKKEDKENGKVDDDDDDNDNDVDDEDDENDENDENDEVVSRLCRYQIPRASILAGKHLDRCTVESPSSRRRLGALGRDFKVGEGGGRGEEGLSFAVDVSRGLSLHRTPDAFRLQLNNKLNRVGTSHETRDFQEQSVDSSKKEEEEEEEEEKEQEEQEEEQEKGLRRRMKKSEVVTENSSGNSILVKF